MHELPLVWLPNVRNNTTNAAETPKEPEKVSHEGESSNQQALHLGQMLNNAREEDEEVLETTEMAYDADIPKLVETVHASSIPIKTPPPNISLAADSSPSKAVPANTEAELPAISVEDDHGNPSRPSTSRQSHSPLLKAGTNDRHSHAGPEPESLPSRSPSIVFLYSSTDSQFRTSTKRVLKDQDSHGQKSKRLKQEEAQQEVVELKEAEEGTKDSSSVQTPDAA